MIKTGHICYALGCSARCPVEHLMCRACWAKVPRDVQLEVHRAARARGRAVDASWAPWWRAQAAAVDYVGRLSGHDESRLQTRLDLALDTAARLERLGAA